MGMFDYVRCKYPLPVSKYQERLFQTKDTPAQFLEHYEITQDGTLRHEIAAEQWEEIPITGEICFYDFPTKDYKDGGWVEFSAYFVKGKLREINLVEDSPPEG